MNTVLSSLNICHVADTTSLQPLYSVRGEGKLVEVNMRYSAYCIEQRCASGVNTKFDRTARIAIDVISLSHRKDGTENGRSRRISSRAPVRKFPEVTSI